LASYSGTYFETVVMTALTVITLFIIILVFLYMIWGREETAATETKPKP